MILTCIRASSFTTRTANFGGMSKKEQIRAITKRLLHKMKLDKEDPDTYIAKLGVSSYTKLSDAVRARCMRRELEC